MRKYLRQIAKARMKANDIGKVNKKMAYRGHDIKTGKLNEPLWKRWIYGEYAKVGVAAQLGQGVRSRRKLKKVPA